MEYEITVESVKRYIESGHGPTMMPREQLSRSEIATSRALLGIMERLERIAELVEAGNQADRQETKESRAE